jgi:hypothetical protein
MQINLGIFILIMQKEIFKDIPNHEGIYQVSDLGNVKSLERIAIRPKSGNYIVKEKILKPCKDKDGYHTVNLKQKTMKIHILVAMAFLGHVPSGTNKICVDHINNIKNDNRLENLQLLTNRQNISKGFLGKKTSSQYIGVSWCKRRNIWRANIYINGKRKSLGYYKTEIEAHSSYQKALELLK